MSLSRDRIIYSFCPNVKIKMPTSRFVRDKKYKGFSKFIMENFFKKFQILKFIFEGLRCISGRYVALMTPPHMGYIWGGHKSDITPRNVSLAFKNAF